MNNKYWMICPKCKCVLGKSSHGEMELICNKCKDTWKILIEANELHFVRESKSSDLKDCTQKSA